MKIVELKSTVSKAIDNFIEADHELLWVDASERAISHKLAEHLQREVGSKWNVDCEYNRVGDQRQAKVISISKQIWKELIQAGQVPEKIKYEDLVTGEHPTVFPDIIIHHRTFPDNLLVVEIKKSGSPDLGWDERKLDAYLRELNYRAGLFLIFRTQFESKDKDDLIDKCVWF